ncbi:DUF6114 domain-containing protein [Streptomyces sp. MST-110588]|uniref:DUF6114 domain-containing protein n=1 Tax=Streptomyces sp. MST-110588 TaxID=2833628 RepID=UPI001F5C603C|nr:DUF6114 domain-containing protein [Streptomyces sp. MST-110588]UNO39877.1 hypothetical protein KGS77_10115 [Streptomyces sp. MST-110588]
MTTDALPRQNGSFRRKRLAFRGWRGRRPFWGGLLTVLAGFPIMYIPYANLSIGSLSFRLATTAGAGSLIIGVLLVVLGLTMWFQPVSRVFAGVAGILLSLVSLVVANFGGFLLGFLPGLIGGALAVSWVPGKPVTGRRGGAREPAGPPGDGPAEDRMTQDLSATSPSNGANRRNGAG